MKTIPLESTIVGNAVKWTNMQPHCWAIKKHQSMYDNSGIPDVIACIDGLFLAGEFKRPKPAGRNPSKIQLKCMDDLVKAGARTGVFRNVESWKMAVEGLLNVQWQQRQTEERDAA